MTHYVIDVTLAHVHVIDYVHLCAAAAVHLVRRVPLDSLMDSTAITRKLYFFLNVNEGKMIKFDILLP